MTTQCMADWIQKLKQQQRAKDDEAMEKERILQKRHERLQLKLLQFIQDTKEHLAEGVKGLQAEFTNDGRYYLRYKSNGEGFYIGGTLPHALQLTLSLDVIKTGLTAIVDGRSMSSASVYLSTELDVSGNLFVEFEGERHYSPEQFAQALMSYVMDLGEE